MSAIIRRIREEPAAVVLFVNACIVAAGEFGLELTPGQATAIVGLVNVGLWLFLRAKVAPVAKLERELEEAVDDHPAGGNQGAG